jgi:hypothetical protein
VPDVLAAQAEVLNAGGAAVGDIVTLQTAAGARVTWCYVRDPGGNAIDRGPNWILSQTFTKVKLPGIPALKAARACLPASGTDFGHDVIHFATHPFLGNANRHGGLKCQYHRCAFLA